MLCVFLNDWEDAGCDYAMRPAEIMIDLLNMGQQMPTSCYGDRQTLEGEGDGLLQLLKLLGQGEVALRRHTLPRHLENFD